MARVLRLPRILGYVRRGLRARPAAPTRWAWSPLLDEARIFVDLALGPRALRPGPAHGPAVDAARLDARRHGARRERPHVRRGVLHAAQAFDFRPVQAGIAASIAMATSPAVRAARRAGHAAPKGQVTERALNLVALNSLVASILVTILLALGALRDAHRARDHDPAPVLSLRGLARCSAASMAWLARLIARASMGRRRAALHAHRGPRGRRGRASRPLLKLSVILALLAFGLFSRNDERSYDLLNVNLGPGEPARSTSCCS